MSPQKAKGDCRIKPKFDPAAPFEGCFLFWSYVRRSLARVRSGHPKSLLRQAVTCGFTDIRHVPPAPQQRCLHRLPGPRRMQLPKRSPAESRVREWPAWPTFGRCDLSLRSYSMLNPRRHTHQGLLDQIVPAADVQLLVAGFVLEERRFFARALAFVPFPQVVLVFDQFFVVKRLASEVRNIVFPFPFRRNEHAEDHAILDPFGAVHLERFQVDVLVPT